MNKRLRLIPRVALFSALIYVLSLATAYLPNINLVFFLVFLSGFMWGAWAGMLVGAVGMALWTLFNPYGPAVAPIMAAQVVGAALGGIVGGLFGRGSWHERGGWILTGWLVLCGIASTLLYYLPVNFVDAWVFQPFWPRFYTGLIWSLISLAANVLIFPLLFRAVKPLYVRERLAR